MGIHDLYIFFISGLSELFLVDGCVKKVGGLHTRLLHLN